MSIAINSNFERDQVIASASQTIFTYSFPIFDDTFITVYRTPSGDTPNDVTQKLNLGTDYSVTGVGDEAGGTIVLTVGAGAGDVITMVGTEPIDRESVFADLNPFTVALNQQLNNQTVTQQQTFTYWDHITPHYNYSELVSDQVRPFKRILPMLPDGYVWVGRGSIGNVPDDIIAVKLPTGGGGDNDHCCKVPIVVPGNDFAVGDWISLYGGTYFKGQADNAIDAECIGVVVSITTPGSEFVLQQSGYIESTDAVFSALTPGPYFLDTAVAGNMVTTDATQNGQVSRPVFDADTASSGWVLPYRGLIVGGAAPSVPPGPPNVIPIPIPNTFSVGDVVYINGSLSYALAQANSLARAQAVGIVIAATPTQFTLQTSGYNTGAVTKDDAGANIVAGNVYYLSPTVPGKLTSTNPTGVGQISKPMYISEQAAGITGTDAGYIMPQRPLDLSGSNNTNPIIPGTFTPGDWVYVSADNTYALAKADTLATSQAVGVVISSAGGNSVIQTNGYLSGIVTQDDAAAPIVSGDIYYLSATVAGAITNTAPSGVGQYTKPLYVQQTLSGNVGDVLEQRPLIVTSGGGGGTGWTLLDSQTASNSANITLTGMTGYYRYMIVLENIIPVAGGNNGFLWMLTSADGGSTFAGANAYAWSSINWVENGATQQNYSDSAIRIAGVNTTNAYGISSTTAVGGASGFINIINPGNTSYYKQFTIDTMWQTYPIIVAYEFQNKGSGVSILTTLIDSVRFYFTTTAISTGTIANISSGTFKLYGTTV